MEVGAAADGDSVDVCESDPGKGVSCQDRMFQMRIEMKDTDQENGGNEGNRFITGR